MPCRAERVVIRLRIGKPRFDPSESDVFFDIASRLAVAQTDACELLLKTQRPQFEIGLAPPCNVEIKNA